MRRYVLVGLMGIMLGWAGGVFAATESVERRLGKLLRYSQSQTQQAIDNYGQLFTAFAKLRGANEQNEKNIENCLGSLDHAAVVMERQTATLRRITEREAHAVR